MKKIVFLCSLLLLVSCKSKTPTVPEKALVLVTADMVAPQKKSKAHDLGVRLLETCNTSRFKAFNTTEATDKVIANATPEKITKMCQKINLRNGRFLGITLLDIQHDESNEEYIFRYSIQYEKKYFKRELTVTLNAENKVSAMATKEIKTKPM